MSPWAATGAYDLDLRPNIERMTNDIAPAKMPAVFVVAMVALFNMCNSPTLQRSVMSIQVLGAILSPRLVCHHSGAHGNQRRHAEKETTMGYWLLRFTFAPPP